MPSNKPAKYQITIQGPLDPRWQPWFDGLAVETDRDGNTLLTGEVPDQSALHGLLARVRDLGLVLLSLRLLPAPADQQDDRGEEESSHPLPAG